MEKQLFTLAIVAASIFGTLLSATLYFYVRDKLRARRPRPAKADPTKPQLARSKFFPDKLFVGAAMIMDPFIKWLFDGALFTLPHRVLVISGFRYFQADGVSFEEICFEQTTREVYKAFYDPAASAIYMLYCACKTGAAEHIPRMIHSSEITIGDPGSKQATFTDESGLIEVDLRTASDEHIKFRLMRVYSRPIGKQREYLFCIMDSVGVVSYFVGPRLKIEQLEPLG